MVGSCWRGPCGAPGTLAAAVVGRAVHAALRCDAPGLWPWRSRHSRRGGLRKRWQLVTFAASASDAERAQCSGTGGAELKQCVKPVCFCNAGVFVRLCVLPADSEDGSFHEARRYPRAPRGLCPPPWLLSQHLDQHLQEQGSHRLLRAAVWGKLLLHALPIFPIRSQVQKKTELQQSKNLGGLKDGEWFCRSVGREKGWGGGIS